MVHHMISVLSLWMRKPASVAVALLCLAGLAAAQSSPTREYIRLGGRIVAIENPITATVDPPSTTIEATTLVRTIEFSSNISPSHWSLSAPVPPSAPAGSIDSQTGKYTAPAATDVTQSTTVTVQLRSTAGGSIMASATILLLPPQPGNCGNSFGPSLTVGSAGEVRTGSVNCAAGIAWSSSTGGASWLSLAPTSGTGPAAVSLTVAPYTSGSGVRTAIVTLAGNSFTVTQHPPCSLVPTSVAVGALANTRQLNLTCPTQAPWTATVSASAQSWLSIAAPVSGAGSATITLNAAANASGAVRSGTVSVDGKQVSVTQSAASIVTLSATPAVPLAHGQTYPFYAYFNGSPNPGTAVWSVISGPGTIANTGFGATYTAPATVEPNNATVVVQATDPIDGGVSTATFTLIPYAAPGTLTISPPSSNELNAMITVAVPNPAGVSLTELNLLISPNITQLQNACSILVVPSTPLGHEIRVQENLGSAFTLPIYAGQSGSAQNSQCRVLASGSTVTVSGNVTSVTLNVQFKPGFIGQMVTGASTKNSTNYVTQMASPGTTWNLTGNVAALLPSGAFTAPAAGATVSGDVPITGWALDNVTQVENAITNIQVLVDNVPQPGGVTMGLSSSICSTYPDRPGCPNVGWTYTWNSRLVVNGTRTIKVLITDGDNPPKTAEITRTVTVYNPPSVPITVQPSAPFVRMLLSGGYNPPNPQFTAYRGAAVLSPVLWSLNPPYSSSGSVNSSGLYTPPSVWLSQPGNQVQVIATNPSDSSDKGSAYATMMGILGGGSYLLDLYPAQQAQFMTSLGSVNYSLSPNLGTITYYGLYTHNAGGYTPGTIVTITATQVGNPNKKETAYVRLW